MYKICKKQKHLTFEQDVAKLRSPPNVKQENRVSKHENRASKTLNLIENGYITIIDES